MAVTWITGNIFTSQVQVIVNSVNCVGVMGAGIALECRLRYPDMYEKYVQICNSGKLTPGQLWLYKGGDRWVLNFPTKRDWKVPSKEQYLHLGLKKFVETYRRKGIESIAFPLLGADRGGLSRDTSRQILSQYLEGLDIPIEIYSYDPSAKDDLYEQFKEWVLDDGVAVLMSEFNIRKDIVGKLVDALNSPANFQLNQLGKTRGIGIKTLEKVFQASHSAKNHPQQIGLDFPRT